MDNVSKNYLLLYYNNFMYMLFATFIEAELQSQIVKTCSFLQKTEEKKEMRI